MSTQSFAATTRKSEHRKDWTQAFSARVDDAIVRLRGGESAEEVREEHGAIVTRAAVRDIKARAVTP